MFEGLSYESSNNLCSSKIPKPEVIGGWGGKKKVFITRAYAVLDRNIEKIMCKETYFL